MQLRIVYLDDEPDLCINFKENFESPTIKIETFTDPQVAIQSINQNPPDLIFLDFRLPGTTGEVVAGELSPTIPKALITGDLTVKPSSKFSKVFSKPFDFSELETFIASFEQK